MTQKRKRMTAREKRERAQVKKELQAKGILPQDKKPLNRKRYIKEAIREWDARDMNCHIWMFYLIRAITYVTTQTEGMTERASPEAIGAAKVLKIALRLYEFSRKLKEEGKTECRLKEEYECVRDILEA